MANQSYSLNGRIKGARPPAAPGIETEVVRITSTDRRHFYLLSHEPWGAYFHWNGASLKCDAPEKCELCEKQVAQKWRAYIHAFEQLGTVQRSVILEITHTCTVLLDVQLCGQPWRGSYCVLSKTKGGKHGRFVVEVMPRRIDQATLANEINPQPIMEKLWLMNMKKRTGQNPTNL